MKNVFLKSALIVTSMALAGCSNFTGFSGFGTQRPSAGSAKTGLVGTVVGKSGKATNVNITMVGGGEIGLKSMNEEDKSKMSKALDAALGKSTRWENGITGIHYTVTPTQKETIQGNPFCRQYQVIAMKGENRKVINGTACVTTDGSWHTI
jgi:surface antigen